MSSGKIFGKVAKIWTQERVYSGTVSLSGVTRNYALVLFAGLVTSSHTAANRMTRMHPFIARGHSRGGLTGFAGFCSSSYARSQTIVRSSRKELRRIHEAFNELPRSTNSSLRGSSRHSSIAVVVNKGSHASGQLAPSPLSGSLDTSKRWSGSLQAISHYGKCYFELGKARLSFFVVSSAAVGFVMGSGEAVNWAGLAWTTAGTMLVALSANSFNQILEVVNDGKMKRTMRRPLPAGRISMLHASMFAMISGMAGVAILAWKTNILTAELGLANLLLYTLVYTPMKQIHYVNTWVGALVGAIPPLMGWAAATGQVDAGGCVLASALYFWQIPHFMALAFLCRRDYAAGGYKMLSLFDSTGQRTAFCALRNCTYLLPVGFLASHWGLTSIYFGAESLLLTIGIGVTSVFFCIKPNPESARRLFRVSLLYLPVVMSGMVLHRIPHSNSQSDNVTETAGNERRPFSKGAAPLPPIGCISAAPFPFLAPPEFY